MECWRIFQTFVLNCWLTHKALVVAMITCSRPKVRGFTKISCAYSLQMSQEKSLRFETIWNFGKPLHTYNAVDWFVRLFKILVTLSVYKVTNVVAFRGGLNCSWMPVKFMFFLLSGSPGIGQEGQSDKSSAWCHCTSRETRIDHLDCRISLSPDSLILDRPASHSWGVIPKKCMSGHYLHHASASISLNE